METKIINLSYSWDGRALLKVRVPKNLKTEEFEMAVGSGTELGEKLFEMALDNQEISNTDPEVHVSAVGDYTIPHLSTSDNEEFIKLLEDSGVSCPRDPITHNLPTDPNVYGSVIRGERAYDIRRDNRDYRVGDSLNLMETRQNKPGSEVTIDYTGRECKVELTHILKDPEGLDEGWCLLSIRDDHTKHNVSRDRMIDIINSVMPKACAAPSEDFDGNDGGIWIRGSEDHHTDDEPVFNYYGYENTGMLHPLLYTVVDAAGWFGEPHDAGTVFLWES